MKFSSVPAYSFGSKTLCEPPGTYKLNPGPGTYEVREENIIVPAPIFNQATRPDLFLKNDYPGPNHYFQEKLVKSKSQKTVKPLHLKEKSDKTKIVPPGPDAYHPHKSSVMISYSMGNKVYGLAVANKEEIGPGSYQPNYKSIQVSRASEFSKTSRKFNYETGTPGPGAYEMPKSSALTSRFGTSERNKVKDLGFPGPGNYEISRGLGGTMKSLTSRRPLPVCKDKSPGPGAYDIKKIHSGPSIALGNGYRANFIQPGNNPGPGTYEPIKPSSSTGKTIGKGLRPPLETNKATPGPGTYFTCKESDNVFEEDQDSEGEISRNPKFNRNDNGFKGTMDSKGGRKVTKNPDKSNFASTEIKGFEKTSEKPRVYPTNKKSFFQGTMQGRGPEAKINDNPGPGQYNPSLDFVKSKSSSIIIGSGNRWNNTTTQRNRVPGPGEYENFKKDSAPIWTFPKDPKSKVVEDEDPGPGHYDIPPTIPDPPKYLMLHQNLESLT